MHISSVLPPELVYKNMVAENRQVDTFRQLMRRLDFIFYHWKENQEYKSFSLPADKYVDYENLKMMATGCDGFVSCKEKVF